jgi:uncharacterized repeat protein (TIGR02543 family)
MNISRTIRFLFLILLVNISSCKKSVDTEGIQALCPIVISTDPMQHAVDIDYDKVIRIDFNTAMDSNSINSNSLLIQDAASTSILTGTIATTEDPSAYIFTPDLPLLSFNQYNLTVKKTATSLYRLAMLADYTSNFTTIPSLALFSSTAEGGIVIGAGNYANGSNVAISAIHSTGYVFTNWTDNKTNQIISTSPDFLYYLDGNHSLTAHFIPLVIGKFSVNLSSNPAVGGTTMGAGAYDAGSTVLIQARANNNFSFANWTKDGNLISLNPSFQIPSLTSNSLYIANFNANPLSQITLTVSSNPITGGTATGGGTYNIGRSVTINATAFIGHRFINWTNQFTGVVISTSASYTFVLNSNKNIVANYSTNKYTIATNAVNGTIIKNPDQLDYNHGTNLQLTAVPKAGYSFTSWSGDTIATSNPLTIKMVSNKTITANFTAIPPATYTITITSNNGTVAKSPNSPSYTSGTSVQLTATPIAGYQFSSWSGDTVASINPVNIKMNKNKKITANFIAIPITTFTLNTIGINGAITLSPNQIAYDSASVVQLNATPNPGYTFSSWSGDTSATSNPLIISMNANKTITGNFTPIPPATYTLNIASNHGIVAKNPNQISYSSGVNVLLSATPAVGYTFSFWSGDASGFTNPLSVSMTTNKDITANFAAIPIVTYTLTTTAINGAIVKSPNQTNYNIGTTVQLIATPADGYTFTSWSGDAIGTTNPLSVSMTANKNITANFTLIPITTYTLNTIGINGSITLSPNQTAYNSGSTVQLTATPNSGYTFSSWSGDTTATSNPLIIGMNANKTITGNFSAIPPATYTLNIASNNGTVTKNPNQISYTIGTTVQLTATPAVGYTFSSWSGDATGSTNPLSVSMTNNKNITANFTLIPIITYTLTTTATNGAIIKSPNQANYNTGTTVQLIATPADGYTFSSWSGDATGSTNPLSVSMTTNKNITANFTLIPIITYTLTTTATNGIVSKSPSQPNYISGATVQLTATPADGYTFTSWSGDATGSTNPLSVSMTANKNITANFTLIPIVTYTLTTTATNGLVAKSPSQPNYISGATVQLTATPADGYTFTSWSGDATGSTNPLSVSMTANKNITANFTLIPIVTYTLTTTAINGTVAKSPNQTNYNIGTTVQLTATPAANYRFGSWSGDASGSTNPLSVNMISNKNITANFIAIPPPVVLGSIANFGAYGGNAGITNQGVETVIHNGAIGTTAAATLITGFHDGVTGTPYTETPLNIGNVEDGIFTSTSAAATNALSDANTAYLSMSPASKPGGTDPGAGELGGLTLTPGIYKSSIATYKITNADLILDAQGDPYAYWIFQMTAGLTVGGPGGARNVILRGGAQAKNVFWYVGSAAVINYAGGGTMVGTIIATAGVTLSSPASSTKLSPLTVLNGRAISLVASVTMVNTVINNQ